MPDAPAWHQFSGTTSVAPAAGMTEARQASDREHMQHLYGSVARCSSLSEPVSNPTPPCGDAVEVMVRLLLHLPMGGHVHLCASMCLCLCLFRWLHLRLLLRLHMTGGLEKTVALVSI